MKACQLSVFSLPEHSKKAAAHLSIQDQTGWRRPHPEAVCQDHDVLLRITQYDYDLEAPGFHMYHRERRGLLRGTGLPLDERVISFYRDHHKTKEQYIKEVGVVGRWGEEKTVGLVKTEKQLETEWLLVLLARAKLQDSWELWTTNRCVQSHENQGGK